jgi:outer membrane lipoprotein SlyB
LIMIKRVGPVTFILGLFAIGTSVAPAQSTSTYDHCVAYAQQQSGFNAAPSTPRNAPLKGAAAGAAGGAFLGGITGGSAGTGAAIGAAFGAIAGEARRRQVSNARQTADENFNNAFNACMNRPPH